MDPRSDFARVARAIAFLDAHRHARPDLDTIARSAGLSPFHFHRLFARWVGISPKKFLQYLTLEHARARLAASATVLDAAFDAGLSGPGRLHDLLVTHDAVTPGELRRGGEGLVLRHGIHPTPFGRALVARTERGLCALAFLDPAGPGDALADLAARYPRAQLRHDPDATGPLATGIFRDPGATPPEAPLALHLRGTRFQLQVWEALLRVPAGAVLAYEDLAARAGLPGATRAVAGAVAANPVAYVIPCHRVIRKHGLPSDYRWGRPRKLALLGWESSRAEPLPAPRAPAAPTPDERPLTPPARSAPRRARGARG